MFVEMEAFPLHPSVGRRHETTFFTASFHFSVGANCGPLLLSHHVLESGAVCHSDGLLHTSNSWWKLEVLPIHGSCCTGFITVNILSGDTGTCYLPGVIAIWCTKWCLIEVVILVIIAVFVVITTTTTTTYIWTYLPFIRTTTTVTKIWPTYFVIRVIWSNIWITESWLNSLKEEYESSCNCSWICLLSNALPLEDVIGI
jgi:hypothetical protein